MSEEDFSDKIKIIDSTRSNFDSFFEKEFEFKFVDNEIGKYLTRAIYYDLKYFNQSLSLNASIQYGEDIETSVGFFNVWLTNRNNDTLNIMDEYKNNGYPEKYKAFRWDQKKDSFQQFTEDFFEFVQETILVDYKNKFQGEEYKGTPIDWAGYK